MHVVHTVYFADFKNCLPVQQFPETISLVVNAIVGRAATALVVDRGGVAQAAAGAEVS